MAAAVRIAPVIIGITFVPWSGPAPAQTSEPSGRTLRIPRVSRAPKLGDFLNGAPREAETEVTDFRQRAPGDGAPVSLETVAYLSYDDKHLYAVFVCRDDPAKVRARMARREDIDDDDNVAIFLDTFHDRQRTYFFAVNPLGIQQDSSLTEGQQPDRDLKFDTVWYSEGRLTPQGYIVWVAIPFKSLRFPDAAVQTWGIALGRGIPRNNESAFWPYITKRIEGFVPQLGTLEGIERVSPASNVQFIPYGAFARARFLDSSVPGFSTKNDGRGGLDAKVVMRNALTLDVTLNPDFSQVESDDPQVTINQRFEVFFPEKRPFFIENAGFFQAPINLFFSRRIADPEFGGRLTGKVGRWVIGALASDDRAPGRQVEPRDALYGSRAAIGAFRLQREFGSQSNIGILATSRDFGSSFDRVVSLDTRIKLSPVWYLTGQVAHSYDHDLKGNRRDGPAYQAELLRGGRHFNYTGSYSDRSPDFRAPLGFIQRVDVRQTEQKVGYSWLPTNSRLLRFGPDVRVGGNWDRGDRAQDWYVNASFRMDFTGPTEFVVGRYQAYELYLGRGFRHNYTGAAGWYKRKRLSVTGSQIWGTDINYSPGPGLAPFLANSVNSSLTVTLRPVPRLRLDEIYLYTRLGTRRGFTPQGFSDSIAIFNNHLVRTRLNYQFSKALSLRLIQDYSATLSNPALVSNAPFKRLTGDVLLTYLLNPGTALYVGYTDRYDNVALDLTTPPMLRPTPSPTTSTARQFFVKVSYLFRY